MPPDRLAALFLVARRVQDDAEHFGRFLDDRCSLRELPQDDALDPRHAAQELSGRDLRVTPLPALWLSPTPDGCADAASRLDRIGSGRRSGKTGPITACRAQTFAAAQGGSSYSKTSTRPVQRRLS
jgi:hypothetical protein